MAKKRGRESQIRIWNPTDGTHYMTQKNKWNKSSEKLELMKYWQENQKRGEVGK